MAFGYEQQDPGLDRGHQQSPQQRYNGVKWSAM